MRRGGAAERYLRLLERARELAPDIFLRTTFIVGFPGETEEHFEHLLDFVERGALRPPGRLRLQPGGGHAGRRACRTRCRRRWRRAAPAASSSRRRSRSPSRGAGALVGRTLEVLVEGAVRRDRAPAPGAAPRHGARRSTAALLINDGVAPAGTLVEVEITDAFASDLVGRIVGPAGAPGVVPRRRPETPMQVVHDALRCERPAAGRRRRRSATTTASTAASARSSTGCVARRRSSAFRRSSSPSSPIRCACCEPERAPLRLTTDAQSERCSRRWHRRAPGWCASPPSSRAIPAREFVRDFLAERLAVREIYVGSRLRLRPPAGGDAGAARADGGGARLSRPRRRRGRARRRADLRDPDPARARSRARSRRRADCSAGPTRSRARSLAATAWAGDSAGRRSTSCRRTSCCRPTASTPERRELSELPGDLRLGSPTSAPGRRCTRTTSAWWRATSSDFDRDVYGERVELRFHKRLRRGADFRAW